MGSPPDDKDFRRAVAGVAPLAEPRRVVLRPDPPPPLPRQSERDERAALAESLAGPVSLDDALESGDELCFLREGLSRQVLRKLRRGHWVVEDSLDLHGMNRIEAALSVAGFLRRCAARCSPSARHRRRRAAPARCWSCSRTRARPPLRWSRRCGCAPRARPR